jgi:hypothetical protein
MQPHRILGVGLILLAGCGSCTPDESAGDPFLAGLSVNKGTETVVPVEGASVSFWLNGTVFGPPNLIDLTIDMTGFADWENPDAAVRVKAACPTIGGARQTFEKEYHKADLTKYDARAKRALIVIPQVVGTDEKHESENSSGKHELTVKLESNVPPRTATATCSFDVIIPKR